MLVYFSFIKTKPSKFGKEIFRIKFVSVMSCDVCKRIYYKNNPGWFKSGIIWTNMIIRKVLMILLSCKWKGKFTNT